MGKTWSRPEIQKLKAAKYAFDNVEWVCCEEHQGMFADAIGMALDLIDKRIEFLGMEDLKERYNCEEKKEMES